MNTTPLTIHVECYPGYRGEETQRRFFMGDKAIEVEKVIDRWLSPEYRYFKVRGGENDIYILSMIAVQCKGLEWEIANKTWAHISLSNNKCLSESEVLCYYEPNYSCETGEFTTEKLDKCENADL